jgi:succinate dehydrogenase / fumarate reductase cytochrome b subunit
MSRNPSRPLSPHLTIWRWGPAMLVSILHRVTGGALSVAGLALLVWWLVAIAGGPAAYSTLVAAAKQPLGLIVMIGISWAYFQHLLSGMRHLLLDTGAGYELSINKASAIATIVGSIALTIALWVNILGVAR